MRTALVLATTAVVTALIAISVGAHAPSGAIFTTLIDGSEVNFNQYNAPEDVYLDGGPGRGAPDDAAGLDAGPYVFQVTNPSGRTLLSTDLAEYRQFTVSGGVIVSTAPSSCPHETGIDENEDQFAITVQLMPFAETNNPGGVYKVWVTPREDYLAGCAELGVPNGLAVVDCGSNAGNFHGFIPAHSKTDNFKIKQAPIREIDTRFFVDSNGNELRDDSEPWVDGLGVTWSDTLGASNKKWSYYAPELVVFHEAHVEGVENGIQRITIADQPGCTVIAVNSPSGHVHGPQTVDVEIRPNHKEITVFIDVICAATP
jgi:hypothetical protein